MNAELISSRAMIFGEETSLTTSPRAVKLEANELLVVIKLFHELLPGLLDRCALIF